MCDCDHILFADEGSTAIEFQSIVNSPSNRLKNSIFIKVISEDDVKNYRPCVGIPQEMYQLPLKSLQIFFKRSFVIN